MRDYIFNGAVLCAGIAVILTALCSVLCPQILHILSVPEDIYDNAYSYLLIIFLGIPFTILYNYLSSILRSVGDSRTPFIFLALSAVLNIFLDLFCIVVLKLGCAGAAIATISAQAISGILCLIFIIRKMKLLWLKKENRTIKGDAVKELLAMGMPTGLQFSITAIGSMVMQSANNRLGSTYVSAFTTAMKIKQFTMCPFDAIATSASVFCSQNLGAGQSDRIKKGLRCGITVGVGYGIVAGILLIFAGHTLSMLLLERVRWQFWMPLPNTSDVWDFLLESWYSQCRPYGNSRTWIFRQSRFLRRNRNDRQNSCLSWICRNFWLHSHLLRRPDCLDHSNLLYFSDSACGASESLQKCLHL